MSKTNFTVNLSESVVVPDTGLNTHYSDGAALPSILIFMVLLFCAVVFIVSHIIYLRKNKAEHARRIRNISLGLFIFTGFFTCTEFLNQNRSFADDDPGNALTTVSTENLVLNASNIDTGLTFIKDTITIKEATSHGYTLTITPDNIEKPLINTNDTNSYFSNLNISYPNVDVLAGSNFGISLVNPRDSDSEAIYSGFPINVTIDEATAADSTIDVYYAINQTGLAAGIYTGAVDIVAVENEPVFSGITTMQQMTNEICTNETTPLATAAVETKFHTTDNNKVPTTQLNDVRDNKKYWVAKLADGKCWMTQNLDFDLTATLSPATSNVSSDWTPERTTVAENNLNSTTWSYDDNHPYSYDRGNYYSPNGSTATLIDTNTLAPDAAELHYHIGNYYNWSAVVASNNTSSTYISFTKMPDSICPKGWKLPLVNDGPQVGGDVRTLNNTYGGVETSDSHLLAAPLYFVQSGHIESDLATGDVSLDNTGIVGWYWSNTVSSGGWAYRAYFYDSYIHPNFNWYRGSGVSVRCVAG